MDFIALWDVLSGYPTGFYTILLGVLLIFWLFVILGAIDIDVLQVDTDVDFDVDVDVDVDIDVGAEGSVAGFAGLLQALGFTGVPITIVLSVLIFIAWVFTYLVSAYLLPLVPTTLFKFLAGTGTIIGTFMLALPITSKVVAPLRELSKHNDAKSNKDFLGTICIVKSLTVDETFGQGEIQDNGAGLIVSIRAREPNEIKKGDIVRPISYDNDRNLYQVVPNREFEDTIERLSNNEQ